MIVHVVSECLDELEGELGVVVGIELSDGFLSVEGGRHLTSRVTGLEQAGALHPSLLAQALVGDGHEPPGLPERIVLAAPVAQHLVLDPSPALIHLGSGELDHMKRIGHLDGVRDRGIEDRSEGTLLGRLGLRD